MTQRDQELLLGGDFTIYSVHWKKMKAKDLNLDTSVIRQKDKTEY